MTAWLTAGVQPQSDGPTDPWNTTVPLTRRISAPAPSHVEPSQCSSSERGGNQERRPSPQYSRTHAAEHPSPSFSLPSSHCSPSSTVPFPQGPQPCGSEQAPVEGLQTGSTRQPATGAQVVGVPVAQWPATQWSAVVQKSPSSQSVPSGAGGEAEHWPVVGL